MALTRLNFIAENRWWPRTAWLWLVPAAALFAWASYHWYGQQQLLQQWQSKLRTTQGQHATPRVQRSAQEQRELEVQASSAVNAVRQINFPLPNLLKALQAPRDIRGALLNVEIGSKSGNAGNSNTTHIKILAEAKTGADMSNYLAFLDDLPVFQSVYLQKHEIPQDSKEGHYRFQLEMLWQP